MIPADMVILATASNNVCYVETKDIDGETNLKHKVVPSGEFRISEEEYGWLSVECEPASDKIYSFQGVLLKANSTPIAHDQMPLMYENFVLRGCSLRNTEFMVGTVCYVGADTRIMRNSVIGSQKKSDLEQKTNLQIIFVFFTMLGLCAIAATYVLVWDRIYEDSTNVYLQFYPQNE